MSGLHASDVAVVRGGVTLIEGVDVDLLAGQVTVVIGENGAGKTTLLDALCGIRAPTRGVVTLDGVRLSDLRPRERARRVASLGQGDVYAPGVVVTGRIGQGLSPARGAGALLDGDALARVRVVAKELGADGLLARRLSTLSGGERRRVDVARALVDDDAAAFVLDEPHAGVDARHQRLVSDAVARRARDGHIVVVTVHDLSAALELADRVIGLRGGRVVADDTPERVFTPEVLQRIYGVSGAVVTSASGARGVVLDVSPRP